MKRDFATWPTADATPGKQAGGNLNSGGPSDTTTTTLSKEQIRALVKR